MAELPPDPTTSLVVALAETLSEEGQPQLRQLHRLALFFGWEWMVSRMDETRTSTAPTVVRRQDGVERSLGARFFRCCRRAAWKAYQQGMLASREALDWLFSMADVPAPGPLLGTGEPRRKTRGGVKRRARKEAPAAPRPQRAPTPPKAPRAPRLPPIPVGPSLGTSEGRRLPRHLVPLPTPEVYVVVRRPAVARDR